MNYKKVIAVAVILCLSLSISGLDPLRALADDATVSSETETAVTETEDNGYFDVVYEASDAYKSSKYYENLKKLSKSGDQAIDAVAVALSQLGYHEGDGEADFGGLNAEGSRDFVEYNLLFGKLDNNQGNGLSYGYSWCASFLTWSLRHAGVDEAQSFQTNSKTDRSCWQWQDAFEAADAFHPIGDGYVPEIGDIAFLKNVDDSSIKVSSSHVGLVLYSDGEKVYTVEGNTNSSLGAESDYDCVSVKSYPLDSKYLVGYGSPDYKENEDATLVGWQPYSNSSFSPASLSELFEKMRAGEAVMPIFSRKGDVGAFEIIAVSVVGAAILAAITVLAVMTFKKKPDDRNSGRRKETKKSRNKYSKSNKVKKK